MIEKRSQSDDLARLSDTMEGLSSLMDRLINLGADLQDVLHTSKELGEFFLEAYERHVEREEERRAADTEYGWVVTSE